MQRVPWRLFIGGCPSRAKSAVNRQICSKPSQTRPNKRRAQARQRNKTTKIPSPRQKVKAIPQADTTPSAQELNSTSEGSTILVGRRLRRVYLQPLKNGHARLGGKRTRTLFGIYFTVVKELHAFLADYLVEISVGHTHIFAEAKGSGPCLSKQVLSIFFHYWSLLISK